MAEVLTKYATPPSPDGADLSNLAAYPVPVEICKGYPGEFVPMPNAPPLVNVNPLDHADPLYPQKSNP